MSVTIKNNQSLGTGIILSVSFFFIQILWYLMGEGKSTDLPDTSLFTYFQIGFGKFLYFGISQILLIVSFFLFKSKPEFIYKQLAAFIISQILFLYISTFEYSVAVGYIIQCFFAFAAFYIAIENLTVFKLKEPRIFIAGFLGGLSGVSLFTQIKDFGVSFKHVPGSLSVFTIGIVMAEFSILLFSYFFLVKLLEKNEKSRQIVYGFLNIAIIIFSIYLGIKQIASN